MKRKDFEKQWANITNTVKTIILYNEAQFYADAYFFSIDGLYIVLELRELEIGTVNLKSIMRVY